MKREIVEALLQAHRLDRAEIFVPESSQMPITEQKDATVPQIGFVGEFYRSGGDVLLGINPGGGGDAYVRTVEDSLLLPMIAALRSKDASIDALKAVFDKYAANMRTWNLWRIVEPVLNACGSSQTEIAYLNWCPFRTRKNAKPNAQAMRRCQEAYIAPLIQKLAPGRIIALGKKVGTHLEHMTFGDIPKFVVPRKRGDSYISDEAREVLNKIKKSRQ